MLWIAGLLAGMAGIGGLLETSPPVPSSKPMTRGEHWEQTLSQGPNALKALCGTPAVDDSSAYASPRPLIPRRWLDYHDADGQGTVRFLYKIEGPPKDRQPYDWPWIYASAWDIATDRQITLAASWSRVGRRCQDARR